MIDLGNWLDEVYRFSRPLGADDLGDDPELLARLTSGSNIEDPTG